MKIAINIKAVDVTIRVTESFTRLEMENSEVTLCLSNALDSGFILRCVTFSLYCVYVYKRPTNSFSGCLPLGVLQSELEVVKNSCRG